LHNLVVEHFPRAADAIAFPVESLALHNFSQFLTFDEFVSNFEVSVENDFVHFSKRPQRQNPLLEGPEWNVISVFYDQLVVVKPHNEFAVWLLALDFVQKFGVVKSDEVERTLDLYFVRVELFTQVRLYEVVQQTNMDGVLLVDYSHFNLFNLLPLGFFTLQGILLVLDVFNIEQAVDDVGSADSSGPPDLFVAALLFKACVHIYAFVIECNVVSVDCLLDVEPV